MSNTSQTQVYKNVMVNGTITVFSGQTNSTIYDNILSPDNSNPSINHGASSTRRITFPVTWTSCDVTFLIYNTLTDLTPTQLTQTDGANAVVYIIPATSGNQTYTLVPSCFDSIAYFQIVCNVAQAVDSDILIISQPIYQGTA